MLCHVSAIVVVTALVVVVYRSARAVCNFPKSWRGVWFEVDHGDVIIGQSNISSHGNCYHTERGYYLLDNRELDCQICMLIEQRHPNVLQYQQSFCVSRDTMYRACLGLDSETVQHTLIRELSSQQLLSSVACPLRDAYHFSYVNNSGGPCSYPASYVTPCASISLVRFHFKRCPDAAYAYEQDVDVRCVATWVDGAFGYFVGRLSSVGGADHGLRYARYRCYMYRVHGTIVYMSLSADASCRGLISPRDGPTTLELTQDVFGWPKSQCTFPAWTTRNVWRDLTGRHLYTANDMGDVIEVLYRAYVTSSPEVNKSLRCYRILARNTTSDHVTVVAFVMIGCSSKYQCITFVKRKDAVIEIHEGRYVDRANEYCYDADMLDSNKRLLIADTSAQSTMTPCPFQGQHTVQLFDNQYGGRLCPVYFRSGCNGTNLINVVDTCKRNPELKLECIRSWREHKKHYVIGKMVDSDITSVCYSFRKARQSESVLEFHLEPSCDVSSSVTSPTERLMYVIDQLATQCQTDVASSLDDSGRLQRVASSAVDDQQLMDDGPTQGSNNISVERGQQNRHGNRYRHVEKNDWSVADDDTVFSSTAPHHHQTFVAASYTTVVTLICVHCFALRTQSIHTVGLQ